MELQFMKKPIRLVDELRKRTRWIIETLRICLESWCGVLNPWVISGSVLSYHGTRRRWFCFVDDASTRPILRMGCTLHPIFQMTFLKDIAPSVRSNLPSNWSQSYALLSVVGRNMVGRIKVAALVRIWTTPHFWGNELLKATILRKLLPNWCENMQRASLWSHSQIPDAQKEAHLFRTYNKETLSLTGNHQSSSERLPFVHSMSISVCRFASKNNADRENRNFPWWKSFGRHRLILMNKDNLLWHGGFCALLGLLPPQMKHLGTNCQSG